MDAFADLGPRNSQAEGIGRVVAVAGMACWNNLGRNVVFADASFTPRSVWASTRFPDDDEPSQYDLDVHAILDVPELDAVLVVNHLGDVRGFDRGELAPAGPCRTVEPFSITSFAADVERIVVVGTSLVGSRPRSDGAIGLLVSAPLDRAPWPGAVDLEVVAEHLGEVTALAALPGPGGSALAVGGPGTVTLVSTAGGRVGPTGWQTDVGFRTAVLAWDGRVLWAAGSSAEAGVDDYDWEALVGGGFAALDPADGSILVAGALPDDTAWGTGGVPVVPVGARLAAVGRDGAAHLLDPAVGRTSTVPGRGSNRSLGIAHAAAVGGRLLFGFNRGGYRLRAVEPTRTA